MHELVKFCRDPMRVTRARTAVTVRESEVGYIIRSDRGPIGEHRRDMIAFGSLAMAWVAGTVMWVAPQMAQSEPSIWVKVGITLLLMLGSLLLILRSRSWGNFVIYVDTNTRKLHFGVQSARGREKRVSEARFSEISTPLLKRAMKEGEKSRLLVKVAGQEEPMLIAAGDELTLLAIHDRLVNDLRPIEQNMASYGEWTRPSRSDRAGRRVFPALGPSEVSA